MVLARAPVWDLERHGCRARAYTDVLAACPTLVRVQAPAANRSNCMKMPDVVRKIDRSTELVGGAAPHPVSGHAVNPSPEARWRRPCRHTVPPPDAAPRFQHCHC
ncbi:hypothetical protein XAC3218_180067 [Xanthomonas citri pv. citri]|nr:hypothetical protein XACS584_200018 [Xanthomonas citri pv. citri]CEE80501.1 hypothetical protein XAC3218_180067 [Xanthomonas citri pv. citri]CEE82261.1 hypothetical protein XACLE20_260019 [Xanthomonas citri pv. citri]CEH86893.1 hypothetical protein XACLH37_390019 [Xanthomonas citri pv. citri]CEH87971.1 hypothetical protein XAC3612_450019 [Xanthomonas citri pv. citri]